MKLLALRLLSGNGRSLRGFADVQLDGGITVRDFRVIQEPGKHPVVAEPQASWKDPVDNRIKYKTLITLPQPLKVELDMLILGAWLKEREKSDEHQTPR